MKQNPTAAPVRNARQVMDGVAMLRTVKKGEAALAIFDPQYRQVLDKLKFGNEGARQQERAKLPQMTDHMIQKFLIEVERVLEPSGHLLLWIDKFSLSTGHWRKWLPDATALSQVDMITWNKGRSGMGQRSRRRTEFVMVLQQPPRRADGRWKDHNIDDDWLEYADTSAHPHAKPLQLTQHLIRSVTKRGDLVVDPAAGGYGTLDCCRATGREFIGCDLLEPTA